MNGILYIAVVIVASATFVVVFLAAFVMVVSCSIGFSTKTTLLCLLMLFMELVASVAFEIEPRLSRQH